MSKSQNYIIVLGGVFFIIGVIIWGVFQYIVFGDLDITKQTLSFFKYVIPATLGTALVIIKILNLVEKKELKEKTEQLTEKTDQSNCYAKTIVEHQEEFMTKLDGINTKITEMNDNENKRNADVIKKTEVHNEIHSKINKRLSGIESKLDSHLQNHKSTA